jgi:NADH-quinone oxidoreductase subunit A
MPQNYVPIFIFMAFVGVLLPVTLLAAKLVRPDNPSKSKLMPYECGIDPIDSARGRYTVRYYIVAILFVVFDVETIFLFPWAVKFKAFGIFGLVEMLIFLGILIVGYIWIWQFLFPYPSRRKPAACDPGEVPAIRQQRREHCDVEGRISAYCDRRLLVGDPHRIHGRD